MSTRSIGNKAEDLACEYLMRLGFKILKRNFLVRGGEIDIIARDQDELVFVEVKARWSHKFGEPLESITFWKIKSLLKCAGFYIQNIKWDGTYRFDCMSIDYTDSLKNPKIELVKNIIS